MFIEKIGYFEVGDAMEIACIRMKKADYAIKYFCCVCWEKFRDKQKQN